MPVDRVERYPSALDFAVFVDELLLLAVFAVAGAGLGGTGALAVVLAVVLPAVAAVIWGLWLAPRAARRLGSPVGIVVKIALFTIASGLLAITGSLLLWAVLFWVASVVLLIAAEVSTRRGTSTRPGRTSAS